MRAVPGPRDYPTATSRPFRLRSLACLAALAALVGCGEEFEPKSKLSSLRVLAVRADIPTPRPGDTVDLEMLWYDGKAPPDEPRAVQVVWIGGCFNPRGDAYSECFTQLADLLSRGTVDPTSVESLVAIGDRFSLRLPDDLISGRPATEGMEPYGLAVVFFGVCAGTMGPAQEPDSVLPIGCFDAEGRALGADDFVPGYFSLYSYQNRVNTNPVLTGLEVAGTPIPETEPARVPRCASKDCQKVVIEAMVDPASVELAGALDPEGRQLMEQMWVDYYVSGGELDRSARLVNDAVRGFNAQREATFTPPGEPGEVAVFAVLHDNRGGIDWIRRSILVE